MELDGAIEQCPPSLGRIHQRNPEPVKALFSHRDDLMLGQSRRTRGEWMQAGLKGAGLRLTGEDELVAFERMPRYLTADLGWPTS